MIDVFHSNFDGGSMAEDHGTNVVMDELLVGSASGRISVFFSQFQETRMCLIEWRRKALSVGKRSRFFSHQSMMICIGNLTRVDGCM